MKKRIIEIGGIIVLATLLIGVVLAPLNPHSLQSFLDQLTGGINRSSSQGGKVQKVLGTSTTSTDLLDNLFQVNIPTEFTQLVTFKKNVLVQGNLTVQGATNINGNINASGHNLDLGSGKVLASNLIYGISAGSGISIGNGQSPTITNSGVTSLQGSNGAVSLQAGSNISIDGLKISANVPSANSFANFAITGQTTLSAGSSNDTMTFVPGSGIVLTTNPTDNSLTIGSSGTGGVNLSGGGVSGLLGIGNGGTGTTSIGTAGSVPFSNGASLSYTNAGVSGDLLLSNGSSSPTWISPNSLNLGGPLTVNQGAISPTNITDAFNIGGVATVSALEHFAGSPTDSSFFLTNVGIGTATPSALLTVGSGSAQLQINNQGNIVLPNNGTITDQSNSGNQIQMGSSGVTIQGGTMLALNNQAGNITMNLQGSSVNLIDNPSFEADSTGTACSSLTGYGQVGSPTTCQSSATHYYSGANGVEVVSNSNSGQGIDQVVTGLTSSTNYVASVYVYVITGGVELSTVVSGQSTTFSSPTGEWKRIQVPFTTGSAQTSETIELMGTTGSDTFYTDAWQLESGTTATTYTDGSLGPGFQWAKPNAPLNLTETNTVNNSGSLNAGTYYYRVSSLASSGETVGSNELKVTTNNLPAPTGLSCTPSSSGGYIPANTYYAVLTGTGNGGETTKSNEVSFTTSGSTSSVSCSWTSLSGVSGYKIYLGTSSGNENIPFIEGNVTSVTLTTLPPSGLSVTPSTTGGGLSAGTYYYTVSAVFSNGSESAGSSEVSGTIASGTSGSNTLSWNSVSGAVSYRVYYGTASLGEDKYYTTTSAGYIDTGDFGTGSGADGSLVVDGTTASNSTDGQAHNSGNPYSNINQVDTNITAAAATGSSTLTVNSTSGFAAGQNIFIVQTNTAAGATTGTYEFNYISSVPNGTTIDLTYPTSTYYASTGAQVMKVPNYVNVTVQNGGYLSSTTWNGTIGGYLIFKVKGTTSVDSSSYINMSYVGFQEDEGPGQFGNIATGGQGGGGSYATTGGAGEDGTKPVYGGLTNPIYINLGSGGQWANGQYCNQAGGPAGGATFIMSGTFTLDGNINSNGGNGSSMNGCNSGGGSGGTVYIMAKTISFPNTNSITALPGIYMRSGGNGRIRIDYQTFTQYSINNPKPVTNPSPEYLGSVGPFSATPTAITGQAPPSSSSAGSSTNTIYLSWDSDPHATGYKIYRGTTAGGESSYYTVNGTNNTSFTDTGSTGSPGTPLIVATAGSTPNSAGSQKLGGLYIGTTTKTGLNIDASGDLTTNGAVTLNGVTTISTLDALGLGVSGTSTLQGPVNITGTNALSVGGNISVGGTSTFSNNLLLNGTNPQINATGSNTLTLNGASNVTGNIQFFNSGNTLSSTGNLTLQGAITQNGGVANTLAGIISSTATGVNTYAGTQVLGTGITNTSITTPLLTLQSASGSTQNVLGFAVGGSGLTERIRADSSGNIILDGSGSGATYLSWDSGSGGVTFGNGSGGSVAHMDSSGNFNMNGTLSVGNQVTLTNGTNNYINFNTSGVSLPSAFNGYKLLLYNSGSGSSDYGIGINSNTLWNNVPTGSQYQWFTNGSTTLATLDSNGNFTSSGYLSSSEATTSAILLSGANSGITFSGTQSAVLSSLNTQLLLQPNNNGVAIGLASSSAVVNTLDVNGGTAIGTYAGTQTAPSNGLIVSGNVGIGTSNPTSALDVNGSAMINGDLTIPSALNKTWNSNQSFNEVGASFSAGMQYPATSNQLSLAHFLNIGNGNDGSVTFSTNTDINTANTISGRTCTDGGDAVNYSVTGLTSNTATLSAVPSAGCLNVGDEVLLINLKGTSTNYGNVGNYETLVISNVSGSQVTFATNKVNYYGDGPTNDTNIGTSSTNQIVMLQRVPNYTNVTVNSGVTVSPSAFNGLKGGVIFFRVSGTLIDNGAISALGYGYRGGSSFNSHLNGGETYDGFGGNGGLAGVSGTTGQGGGGGGGGNASTNAGTGTLGGAGGGGGDWWGGSGGGGGYGGIGGAGTSLQGSASPGNGNLGGNGEPGGNSAGSGGGGGTYGTSNLSKLYFGSGGGDEGESGVGFGSPGGGIIDITASSITVNSSTGSITSSGAVGGNCGWGGCDGHSGGGGGGAGGSIIINSVSQSSIGSSLITSVGGSGGSGQAGPGGNGGSGIIAWNNASLFTGNTNPTANIGYIPVYYSGIQSWESGIVDVGYGNTSMASRLTASWTLDGSDNIEPKFQIWGSNTGAFTGEQTIYPAGSGTYYQEGGTYPIASGTPLDISGQVNTAYRYFRVVVYIDTGSDAYDTPTITSINLSDTRELFYNSATNDLGLGTATPTERLTVVGNATMSGNLTFSGTSVIASRAMQTLQLGDSQTGNINFMQAGNLGIGTTSAMFGVDIQNSQTATSSARIYNTSTSANAGALSLQLGASTIGTGNNLITFMDGNGDIVGKVTGNGSGGVSYATNGIDFAEYYRKANPTEVLTPGEVVCLASSNTNNNTNNTNGGVTVCNTDSSKGSVNTNILGVVSSQAGFVGGGNHSTDPSYVLVGLIGQLPVKVDSNVTDIPSSSPLTISSQGSVIEATQSGEIVGHALQDYDIYTATTSGMVETSINIGWYEPTLSIADNGTLNTTSINGTNPNLPGGVATIVSANTNTTSGNTVLPAIPTQTVDGASTINNQLLLDNLQAQVATLSARVNQIASSEANLQNLINNQLIDTPNYSSTISAQLTNLNLTTDNMGNATISGQLNVIGRTTLTDLSVTGNINTGLLAIDGLNGTIDSMGQPLMLQSLGSAGINLEDGAITIDTNGNMVVNADITAQKYNVDITNPANASLGTAVIPAGQTFVIVNTNAVTPLSEIFVTAKSQHASSLYISNQIAKKSFTVSLDKSDVNNVQFNWWIVN